MKTRRSPGSNARPKKEKPSNEAREAVKRYIEENEDITFAVEAMRRSHLAQEGRARHLTNRLLYRVISSQ